MPADVYYGVGQIRAPNMVEYNHQGMMQQIVDTMHAGPWDAMADEWTHSSEEDRAAKEAMDGEE